MQTDEFTDDIDRLSRAVADGEVSAVVPLADELMAAGHPYGEELGVMAEIVTQTTSFSVSMLGLGLFMQARWLSERTAANTAEVTSYLERLSQAEGDGDDRQDPA